MKLLTHKARDYHFVLKLITKERAFSRKYCKTLASKMVTNSDWLFLYKTNKRKPYSSAGDTLACIFNWHESPEGYNYWYRIHCKLNNGTNVHGEYIGTSDKEIDEALLIPF